jgi:rare lipoprotein A
VIDLSYEAAKRIEMIGPGTAKVEVKVVAPPGVARQPEPAAAPVAVTVTEETASQSCPPGPYYAVQVGSFRDRVNAEESLREMTARYGSARVLEVASGGAALYRVVVGPAADHQSAEQLRAWLSGEGVNGFVLLVGEGYAAVCLTD